MWIINTSDGHTHQILNPETSREAWEEFLTKYYKMEDITALSIKLGNLPLVTIRKPAEKVEWFIEKVAIACRGDISYDKKIEIDGKKFYGSKAKNIGLVIGYHNGIYRTRTICYFNGSVVSETKLLKVDQKALDK